MRRFLRLHWLLLVEVAIAITYFAVFARHESDQGGGATGVVPFAFGAAAVALHRVRPGIALLLLVAQGLTLFGFGFSGRTPTLEMWWGVPPILFSAAFFGGRVARAISIAIGALVWVVLTGYAALISDIPVWAWFDVNAGHVTWTALALVAPPILGAVLHAIFRREAQEPVSEAAEQTPLESLETFAPQVDRTPAESLESFARQAELSPRELEMFVHAAKGMSNGEIAAAEHLSEATVKSHMTRVLAKVGARDRVQLAIIAHSRGLVPKAPSLPR